MAHSQQQQFFERTKIKYPHYFDSQRVLEVGSLNINGTVRDYFTNCDYTGIDLGAGPGVDVIANGRDYLRPEHYSVVISTESFEHNPDWRDTFSNMIANACEGALIIFTCASTGRAEHGTKRTTPSDSPYTCDSDYYKNLTEDDFRVHWNFDRVFADYKFEYNAQHHDLYFYGIKQ
jgi:hypothetical protein